MTKFSVVFVLWVSFLTTPVPSNGQSTTASLVARIEELERIIALLTSEFNILKLDFFFFVFLKFSKVTPVLK